MKELTEELPKSCLTLWGKPLIQWQIEALRGAGIEEIAIVTGYRSERLQFNGITNFHNPSWAETNMVCSLQKASSWLDSGACIIAYSDIFYSIQAILALMNDHNATISVAYTTHFWELWSQRFSNPLNDLETFKLNEERIITEIGRKPETAEEIEGQFAGLLKVEPDSWCWIKQFLSEQNESVVSRLDITSLLSALIEGHIKIAGVPIDDTWLEVDNPTDLTLYNGWDMSRYRNEKEEYSWK